MVTAVTAVCNSPRQHPVPGVDSMVESCKLCLRHSKGCITRILLQHAAVVTVAIII